MGERLGHGVDLGRRQPERRTGVADRVAHPVGVHHRDARDPVAAEVVEDPLVDLGASGRLHVDVDVGQLGPQRGAEALHEQAVAHRVDPGDAEQEVDERAGTRASGSDPHPHLADQVAHLRDGEEVGRVAERLDDAQLVLEAIADGSELASGVGRVAGGDGLAATPGEHVLRVGALADAEHPRLGQVDRPDAEVGPRVLDARRRERRRAGDELAGLLLGEGSTSDEPGPGDLHDVESERVHERCRRQVAGGRDAVEVSGVERDEPAGGVEHVDDRGVLRVGVAHRCRDDARDADLAGQREHAAGLAEAAGQVLGAAVADHLDDDRASWHPGHPALEGGPRLCVPLGEHCASDVGVGAEQDDEPRLVVLPTGGPLDALRLSGLPWSVLPWGALHMCVLRMGGLRRVALLRASMGGDELGGRDGVAALAAQVGRGDEPAQRRPPLARGESDGPATAPGEHRDPRQAGIDEGPSSHRRAHGPAGTGPLARGRLEGQVDAEDRRDAVLHAGPHELHGSVEPVAVGERQRRLAPGGGSLDELVRLGGAVAHGVAARDVQVDEALPATCRPETGCANRRCRADRVGRTCCADRVGRTCCADRVGRTC